MQRELEPEIDFDDGFRRPPDGEQAYVSWEMENSNSQNLFYLHGALHLFDAGTELQKYTWSNTGVRLTTQIRAALDLDKYPLFVAEGTSAEKVRRIRHSDYLSRCFRSFSAIGGALFTYGVSFGPSDSHIIRLIAKGKCEALFVGLYGDPRSETNEAIVAGIGHMPQQRNARRPLDVFYFFAESARVWG